MGARKGGPVPRIGREAIEEAVIEVGFDTATTTTVARRLGVDQSSLYRHISSREELMLGAIDRVLSSYDWDFTAPDGAGYLRRMGQTMWRMLREHRGLSAQLYALGVAPPETVRIMANGVAALRGFGWSVPDAILVLDSISDMTGDTIHQIEGAASAASPYPSGTDEAAAEINAVITRVLHDDPQRWWERKLELLILGAEALRAQS